MAMAAAKEKPVKKEEEEDDVSLSLSMLKKRSSVDSGKVKREGILGDEDEKVFKVCPK